jgi:predicted SAM-dependent methyltransferase
LDDTHFSRTEFAKRETVQCLEIGPGKDPVDGFETLDVIDRPGIIYVAKWGHESLPIPNETYDLVFASHVLEHVCWTRTQNALLEVMRVLKPEGTL